MIGYPVWPPDWLSVCPCGGRATIMWYEDEDDMAPLTFSCDEEGHWPVEGSSPKENGVLGDIGAS